MEFSSLDASWSLRGDSKVKDGFVQKQSYTLPSPKHSCVQPHVLAALGSALHSLSPHSHIAQPILGW